MYIGFIGRSGRAVEPLLSRQVLDFHRVNIRVIASCSLVNSSVKLDNICHRAVPVKLCDRKGETGARISVRSDKAPIVGPANKQVHISKAEVFVCESCRTPKSILELVKVGHGVSLEFIGKNGVFSLILIPGTVSGVASLIINSVSCEVDPTMSIKDHAC